MKLQFKVTFKQGPQTLAVVIGRDDLGGAERLTVADVTEKIIDTEQFLERLTGLRVHIEQVQ